MNAKSGPLTTGLSSDAAHSLYALVSFPNGSPVLGFTGPSLTMNSASNFARPSRTSTWTARPTASAVVSLGSISPFIFLW